MSSDKMAAAIVAQMVESGISEFISISMTGVPAWSVAAHIRCRGSELEELSLWANELRSELDYAEPYPLKHGAWRQEIKAVGMVDGVRVTILAHVDCGAPVWRPLVAA